MPQRRDLLWGINQRNNRENDSPFDWIAVFSFLAQKKLLGFRKAKYR